MSSIEYHCLEGHPSAEVIAWIAQVNQELFAFDETEETLNGFFRDHRKILVCMASRDGQPVGFKVGFEESPFSFESWRGGVVETARRQGIAMELMRLQHSWCQDNGYKVIKTTTNSDNMPMLTLNQQSGFEVVGSVVNRRKRLKLLQEKWLVSGSDPET